MKLAEIIKVAKKFKMDDAHRFAKHVVPEVVRPARVIWNQAIGGIFLLFTVAFLANGYNYYRQQNTVALGFSIFLGLVMAFFSFTSFRQARKIAGRAPRRS
jgi:glycerol uptake facilitator-like aquaporin